MHDKSRQASNLVFCLAIVYLKSASGIPQQISLTGLHAQITKPMQVQKQQQWPCLSYETGFSPASMYLYVWAVVAVTNSPLTSVWKKESACLSLRPFDLVPISERSPTSKEEKWEPEHDALHLWVKILSILAIVVLLLSKWFSLMNIWIRGTLSTHIWISLW